MNDTKKKLWKIEIPLRLNLAWWNKKKCYIVPMENVSRTRIFILFSVPFYRLNMLYCMNIILVWNCLDVIHLKPRVLQRNDKFMFAYTAFLKPWLYAKSILLVNRTYNLYNSKSIILSPIYLSL